MIGKSSWFVRRKYSGWGLTPVSWQGFVYIAAVAGLGALISQLPLPSGVMFLVASAYVALVVADVLHVMATIKVDERESKIEALSERNASWSMVGALAILIIYFSVMGDSKTTADVLALLIFPVAVGWVVKAVSAFVLRNKDL